MKYIKGNREMSRLGSGTCKFKLLASKVGQGLVGLSVLCGIQGMRAQPEILDYDDFKHYVDGFNGMEEEFASHLVSNADSWGWMVENVPAFDCPDKDLEEIYWYRWWTYRKCLIEIDGLVTMTEFIKRKPVSSGVGHHIMESRWVRNHKYGDEILRYWLRGNGEPNDRRRYSGWTIWAAYERYRVTGAEEILSELFADFERYYSGWEADKMMPDGSFWQFDVRDAMEESISGTRRFVQLRPPINSYMYGNAVAMTKIGELLGRQDIADTYREKAAGLKKIVLEDLWDEESDFFKARIYGDYESLGPHADVREAIGYIPWYFNLPDKDQGYEAAWEQLVDEEGFWAPYGITTAERRHPKFRVGPVGTCEWNGPVWPYATSQTLTALGNVLNDYEQEHVTKAHYLEAIQTYAKSMHRDGLPYIGEYLDEVTGEYLRDSSDIERGRYYNHSTFCDLVINNLVGLRPQEGDTFVVNPLIPEDAWEYFCLDGVPYHGRSVTIFWDKTGERYQRGPGLVVLVDGQEAARSDTLEALEVSLSDSTGNRTYDASYESLDTHATPQWFKDAKLGIFVHWGLYSVPAWAPLGTEAETMEGVEWFHHNPYAEWYLNSLRLGDTPTRRHHEETYGEEFDYYEFAPQFNEAIEGWNPAEMAELFARTHARYVVLTSKHHDGFPLWTSEVENVRLPEKARLPSRDIVGEMTKAVRSQGLRMGLYYSGGIDWSFHPVVIDGTQSGQEVTPPGADYANFADAHLVELIDRYQPSVIWNDIRYPGDSDILGVLSEYYNEIPDGVVNDRWGSSVKVPHDYRTQEYKKFDTIQELPWEANRGIGSSFGYNAAEGPDDYLTGKEIVELLVDVVSKNGNLLLNVGPKPDGSIPTLQKERLLELANWLDVNGEAIFDTTPWEVAESENADGQKIHFTYRKDQDAVYAFYDADLVGVELLIPDVEGSEGLVVGLLRGEGVEELSWTMRDEVLAVGVTSEARVNGVAVLRLSPSSKLRIAKE